MPPDTPDAGIINSTPVSPGLNQPRYWIENRLVVTVGEDGTARGFRLEGSADSDLQTITDSLLGESRFHPASRMGKPVESGLPLILRWGPTRKGSREDLRAEFTYPLSSMFLGDVFPLNGYHTARPISFPSYFYDLRPIHPDSSELDFVILKLEVDSTGQRAGTVDLVYATERAMADQIMNAARWADYLPHRTPQGRLGGAVYLAVGHFPLVDYPAHQWAAFSKDSDWPVWERLRLRTSPDQHGIIWPPMPRKADYGSITTPDNQPHHVDTASAELMVGPDGSVTVRNITTIHERMIASIQHWARQTRFYPAITWRGDPIRFTGRALFIFDRSKTVRVEAFWLKNL